ncbi:MAG: hypothetical protein HY799_12615 [Nitrosomonadales bacterium]|nr:hypothetical protein [Nitrosomonadales bacterium]
MDRDTDTEEDGPAPQSKTGGILKPAARYAMLGFAPVVSMVALAVAVIAVSPDRAAPAQSGEAAARMESLGASLAETKNELESLKFSLARERSERKRAEEREALIIQHVTGLQAKLKVAPTLEVQLKEVAGASVLTHAGPVVAPAAVEAPASAAAPATEQKHSATPAPAAHPSPEKKPVAATPASSATNDKTPGQVKALKEAIDKLNKK